MSVRISADSTCDLSRELCEKYNIAIAPLSVIVDGVSFHDGVDISAEVIFRAAEDGKTVKTAAVNRYEYEELFKNLLKESDEVVHFCISNDMSSCYQDACEAAKSVGHVYVVDSRNLSTGTGLLVLEAAELAAMGRGGQEIAGTEQRRTDKVCSSFVVQDVGYLHRGGRCSGLEAIGAKLMRIRPSIEVKDGKMHPAEKYRGKYEHFLKHYIKDKMKEVEDTVDYKRVFITHSPCEAGMVEYAEEMLREYGHFREILKTDAGCTICVHCGPNTLGILFMNK